MNSLPPAFRAAIGAWMTRWESSLRDTLPPGAFVEIKVWPLTGAPSTRCLTVTIVDGRYHASAWWTFDSMAGWPMEMVEATILRHLDVAHARLHDAMIERVARSLKFTKRDPGKRGECP